MRRPRWRAASPNAPARTTWRPACQVSPPPAASPAPTRLMALSAMVIGCQIAGLKVMAPSGQERGGAAVAAMAAVNRITCAGAYQFGGRYQRRRSSRLAGRARRSYRSASSAANLSRLPRTPMRLSVLVAALTATLVTASAAVAQTPRVFTHADTLRGSNTPARAWWDAEFYDLHVRVNPADSSIAGHNTITYRVLQPAAEMQIDLQVPLEVDSIVQQSNRLTWRRDGNAFLVTLAAAQPAGSHGQLTVWYHGRYVRAAGDTTRRPIGPFHWAVDSAGAPWIATSNEGPGACTWWPLKDLPADEPDSQRIAITVPDPMIDVSNGRLRSTTHNADYTTTWEWFVANPINMYDVAVNAGQYAHFSDTLQGESGPLSLDFWSMAYHTDTAKGQWKQATPMIQCFEHWYGPYPWYK